MKEHIETSRMQVSVCLYHVPVRFYSHFKSDQKSLTFFVHAENERSIAQKMRKKILIYSCVNRIEKYLAVLEISKITSNVGCRGYFQNSILGKNKKVGNASDGLELMF